MTNFCENCGTLMKISKGKKTCPNCGGSYVESIVTKQGDGKHSVDNDLFPFHKAREGQKEFMDDAKKTFRNQEVLIAHAPTGIGKTAAVLTSAANEKKEGEKIFFLTSKQSQHQIAIETVKNMPSQINAIDVISKKDMCLREASKLPYPVFEEYCSEKGKTQCNLFNNRMSEIVDGLKNETKHVSEVIHICERNDVCPHKSALSAGRVNDVVVCDYNYIFSDIQERIFEILEIELEDVLLIVDEAHNLPNRIRSNLRESLSVDILHDAFKILQGYSSSLSSFMSRLSNELSEIGKDERRIEKEFLDKKVERAMKGGLSQFASIDDLLADLKIVANDIIEEDASATAPMRVYSFFNKWEEKGEEIFRSIDTNPPRINVKLLDPSRFSKNIFENVRASVLMSGTLHPGEMYADILGVPNAKTRRYQSPFPDENKKIVNLENLTTAYKERDLKMYQAYANSIADVANNIPGNMAVFFPSYDLLNRIFDRLTMVHLEKDLLVEERDHNKQQKKQLVENLKRKNEKILLGVQGGSLSEGIDYRNNILSAVFIVGIPFPPPSLEVSALEEYYRNKFGKKKAYLYSRIYPAMNRVLQAAGRPIRSKKDRAIIILGDKRFNYKRYKKHLPDDLDFSVTSDLARNCIRFFGD